MQGAREEMEQKLKQYRKRQERKYVHLETANRNLGIQRNRTKPNGRAKRRQSSGCTKMKMLKRGIQIVAKRERQQ